MDLASKTGKRILSKVKKLKTLTKQKNKDLFGFKFKNNNNLFKFNIEWIIRRKLIKIIVPSKLIEWKK